MEDNTAVEGNRLIAEFMGYTLTKKLGLNHSYWEKPQNDGFGSVDVLGSETKLKYHTSWDCLCPVVQKINDSGTIIEISWSIVTMCRICVIGSKGDKAFNIIYDSNESGAAIQPVWQACVDFIQWYNTTKQSPHTNS